MPGGPFCQIGSNVSPVYKKGEKYDAANYRPVSLTCICCKTLVHILVTNISKHLALDSILADCQHGFQSQRLLLNKNLLVSKKRIHYLCEAGIEKSVPLDHLFSSLSKPCDAKL